ncbi:MAG: hypothetical protein NPMRTH1_1030012 [Nitrosopumilales archaeon]|nr:MAG: hypothetical protein NPMRTH1_1030012 [Nitrosopumilales archaeon]
MILEKNVMVLRAAVIGCGRIGCGFDDDPLIKEISTHAGAYSKNPKTELFALCDIDKSKLTKYGKKYSVTKLFRNIDELLENAKPDLLSICTQVEQHEEMAIKASNAGVKGIFCEKPIAKDIEQAKKMIDICEKNGTVLIIDHQRRFDPIMLSIKNALNSNQLGKIYHSIFHYAAGIHNTGTHIIDLMGYFFGNIEWVIGNYSTIKSSNENDPNIDGILQFRNGPLCFINALDDNDYWIFEEDILGSKGRLKILSGGFEIEYHSISDSKYFPGYKELQRDQIPFEIPSERELMVRGVDHLSSCVEKDTKPISSGEDGLAALEAITALINSAENDSKKIYLPLNSISQVNKR